MRTRLLTAAVLALVTAVATLGGPGAANATGFGFYGTLGAGTADWDDEYYDDNWGGYYASRDRRDTRHGGAGLVLDAGAPYSPLGYRISVGWERITHDRDFDIPEVELEGIVVDQDLTIQLIGGPTPLRVWAGPELRLGFFDGSVQGAAGDEDFVALGIGPVLGLDFDVSPSMAVSWKLGYLFTGFSGHGSNSGFEDSSFAEGHAYATLGILFSPWGHYRQQPAPQQRPQPQAPAYPPRGYNPRRW